MSKIREKYYNFSLKQKISIMTLLSAMIPVIIFMAICVAIFNNSIRQRSEKQIEENVTVVSERMESIFNSTVLCSNNLTINLNSVVNDPNMKPFNKNNMILSNLSRSLVLFEGINSIVYISEDGQMYSTDYDLYKKQEDITASSYYQTLVMIKNGKSVLFDYDSDCMQTEQKPNSITMGKHITEIGTGKTLGYLFINMDLKHLEQTSQNEITQYFLYDSKNERICTSIEPEMEALLDKTSLGTPGKAYSIRYGGHSYLVSDSEIGGTDWTLVGITNLGVYNISALQLLRTVSIAAIIFFILLIFVNHALTAMITKPLEKLMKGAEEIGNGNLNVEFEYRTNDEIGRTARILNTMEKEIASLIDRVDEEAKKKRSYELALIQEQIKPHFLYNSLDIIIVLNEMNKTKEATRVTRKLANYYKNSLSSSAEFIPLVKEFAIIEDYLDLQLIRYQDQFAYTTNLPAELEPVMVPKMTLQPLVENALYHGLKYKEEWGTIQVLAKKEDDCIKLIVQDDGIGMTSETLAKVKSLQETPQEHFGVYSVSHRLQLYYGEGFQFDIESAYYKGTKITISIPLEGIQ